MVISKTGIVSSLEERIGEIISSNSWDEIILASAFLTVPGADFIIKALEHTLTHRSPRRSPNITILVGVKDSFTQPAAIQKILDNIDTDTAIQLLAPRERNFHAKCYIFKSNTASKMLVGSANLTDYGLQSTGELTVEIDDASIIQQTIDYLSSHIRDSVTWNSIVRTYTNHYNSIHRNMPITPAPFEFPTNTKKRFMPSRRHAPFQAQVPIEAGMTVNFIRSISRDEVNMINAAYKQLSETNKSISKQFYLLYYSDDSTTIEDLEERFPVDSFYDRSYAPTDNGWELGSRRVICKIGATYKTPDNNLIIFLHSKRKDKDAYFEYTVRRDILRTAERLNVKAENDIVPSNPCMTEYIAFVVSTPPTYTGEAVRQ